MMTHTRSNPSDLDSNTIRTNIRQRADPDEEAVSAFPEVDVLPRVPIQ